MSRVRGDSPRLAQRLSICLLVVVGGGALGLGGLATIEPAGARRAVVTRAPNLAAMPRVVTSPVSQPPTPSLTSFSARPAPGDEQVVLSWIYATTTPPARQLHLDLYQVVGGRGAKWGSTVIGRTVEPDRYSIPVFPGTWVVKATPRSDAGFGPEVSSGPVRVGRPCVGATLCARVSLSGRSAGKRVKLAGQGFLHGVDDGAGALRASVQPLRPRQWRYAGRSADARAGRLRVQRRTQVLSDLW
jgi:hypothetical protein